MPVLEIHTDGVRDPYSGTYWSRAELLQEPNSLDAFLSDFDAVQRTSVRGDFYDVGAFYLLMSILKDHGIVITHWHFIGATGIGQEASLASCPAGFSAQDCTGLNPGDSSAQMADVFESLGDGDQTGGNEDGEWPPRDAEWQDNGNGQDIGADQLPQGAEIGPGGSGSFDAESFPDVRASRRQQTGQADSGTGAGSGFSLRWADPTATLMPMDSLNFAAMQEDLESFLAAVMAFLDEVQRFYDNDNAPTQLLQRFIPVLQSLLSDPPTLSDAHREAIEDLALSLELVHSQGYIYDQTEPLMTMPLQQSAHPEALMRVATNRTLIEAEIQSNNAQLLNAIPDNARLRFNLQAYPDIWRGMQIALERHAVLLMSPDQSEPDKPKWRAVAYLAPQLNDFVVGFVFGVYDEDGHLAILAEPNQGMVDTIRVLPEWQRSPFSIQVWMTLLYAVAGLALLALLFFWRPGARLRR